MNKAILLKMWLTDITPLLPGGPLITWSQGNIAQERIEKLLQTISITFEDGVKRVSNDNDKIIIRDYQLSLEGNIRLKINYLFRVYKEMLCNLWAFRTGKN